MTGNKNLRGNDLLLGIIRIFDERNYVSTKLNQWYP